MGNIKLDFQANYKVGHDSAITADSAALLCTEHRTLATATGMSGITLLLIDCGWHCGMQVPAALK